MKSRLNPITHILKKLVSLEELRPQKRKIQRLILILKMFFGYVRVFFKHDIKVLIGMPLVMTITHILKIFHRKQESKGSPQFFKHVTKVTQSHRKTFSQDHYPHSLDISQKNKNPKASLNIPFTRYFTQKSERLTIISRKFFEHVSSRFHTLNADIEKHNSQTNNQDLSR